MYGKYTYSVASVPDVATILHDLCSHSIYLIHVFARSILYLASNKFSVYSLHFFTPLSQFILHFFFVPSCSVCSLYLRCAIFHTTSPCVPVSFWLSQKSFFLRFFVSILITPSVKPLYNFYFQLTWTQCGVAVTLSFLFSLITNATYTATCICRHCPFMCMCLRMCITMFIMYT